MKRRIGRGGIVFLGSMLGPNLHAEEPEAHRIATALLSIMSRAGRPTSKATAALPPPLLATAGR
jgi:hypothetical protein